MPTMQHTLTIDRPPHSVFSALTAFDRQERARFHAMGKRRDPRSGRLHSAQSGARGCRCPRDGFRRLGATRRAIPLATRGAASALTGRRVLRH
jgi:hypothetical protein